MRLTKKSLQIIAVSVCIASAISLPGCSDGGGQGATPPQAPASSSSSSAGGGQQGSDSSSSSTSVEDQLRKNAREYAYHPSNEQGSWARKEGYVFIARKSESGRLYDGKWYDELDAISSMGYAFNIPGNIFAYDWMAFLSVPDDSLGGTNCVWDGKNLNYYPTSVSDKNTYMYKSGMVYETYVSPDGYLFSGQWVDESTAHKANCTYFKSFPYNETNAEGYRWDGSSLQYEVSHVISSADVMTYVQRAEYLGETANNDMVAMAKQGSDGRLYNIVWYGTEVVPDPVPEGWVTFEEFPLYGSSGDIIWNGSTFIYSHVSK